jgi:hypothetical protein
VVNRQRGADVVVGLIVGLISFVCTVSVSRNRLPCVVRKALRVTVEVDSARVESPAGSW